ncbi:hypothetical protein RISK_006767 [Rhodopirellula islandica]|uniref:Uncharacterized protein n=1 Tax=Rhodopirellula islandica TaxID=595434 RepID=A0A0J1B3J4_RHOIS|nr:hypothetical protein RISK_006767 [Rhodopirellula islandica]
MDEVNVFINQNVHREFLFGTSIAEQATQCPLGWKRKLARNCRLAASAVSTI